MAYVQLPIAIYSISQTWISATDQFSRYAYLGADGSPLTVSEDYIDYPLASFENCAKMFASARKVSTDYCTNTGIAGICQKPRG